MKVEQWLERAKKDLDDAKFNLEGGRLEFQPFWPIKPLKKR
jgi:HEPN domain.